MSLRMTMGKPEMAKTSWFHIFVLAYVLISLGPVLNCTLAPRADDVASVKPMSPEIAGDGNAVDASATVAVASPAPTIVAGGDASAETVAAKVEVLPAGQAGPGRDNRGVTVAGSPLATFILSLALGAVAVLAIVFLYMESPRKKKCRPP